MQAFKYFNLSLFVALLLSFFSSPKAISSHPEDRCYVKNCLCAVSGHVGRNSFTQKQFKSITTSTETNGALRNRSRNANLTVYFGYDRHDLQSNDRTDIYKYIRKNYHAGGFYIEGYASSAGNFAYNQKKSLQRMHTAMNYINRISTKPYRFTGESHGERNSQAQDSAYDRKVVIKPVSDIVELLDLKKTDFYLFDNSGSMSGHWNKLRNYRFHSTRVRVYLSTMKSSCPRGGYLPGSTASGGTNIWWSFYNLISKMKPGNSVTIVSDFDTDPQLQNWEWDVLKRRLSDHGIRLSDVHFVQINGAPFTRHILSTK